jgi:hypothetical protein
MIQTLPKHNQHTSISGDEEYSRILSAAVINEHFRQMLLNDPIKAIVNGYCGEQFQINSDDRVRLSAIKAATLADFAAQLSQI